MRKIFQKLFLAVLLIVVSLAVVGCSLIGGNKKKKSGHATGEGRQLARQYWDEVVGGMRAKGEQVNNPPPLATSFLPAHGTLGSGPDRFPFRNMNGGKVGGIWSGRPGGKASSWVARESGGWFNPAIGKHEWGCHHANAQSRNDQSRSGHPPYMQDFCPHWPYYNGPMRSQILDENSGTYYTATPETIITNGTTVCIMVIDEQNAAELAEAVSDNRFLPSPAERPEESRQEWLIGIAREHLGTN